jgi:predicted RNA-binding Zn-ribbon protein involved in translation (DUF1610 family)
MGWRSGRAALYAVIAATECALAIESCHGCSHKLRIPDGKRGTVTCPLCGAQWFHPKTIELSDVEFRCSKSGARFNVISSRRSPLHKFVIQQIERAQPETKSSPMAEPNSSSGRPARQAVPSKVGGWLAQIAGRKKGVIPPMPPAHLREEQTVSATTAVPMHDANEYNWSGFSCPYCGASSFVSCAGGHLACDGTAELRDGRRFHQCFCGHAGFISGIIKNLGSKRLSVEAELNSPNLPDACRPPPNKKPSDVALPPPRQGAPLLKRGS